MPLRVQLSEPPISCIGCDEDEAAFEKRLREIAKTPPPKPDKKKPR
jgi:hypothetical protein